MENWKPVPGYEGHYEVSDRGRVRSLKRGTTRVLKPIQNPQWGLQHGLSIEGRTLSYTLARLVCMAFHGPANGRVARYKSSDCTDARPQNVEWVDR